MPWDWGPLGVPGRPWRPLHPGTILPFPSHLLSEEAALAWPRSPGNRGSQPPPVSGKGEKKGEEEKGAPALLLSHHGDRCSSFMTTSRHEVGPTGLPARLSSTGNGPLLHPLPPTFLRRGRQKAEKVGKRMAQCSGSPHQSTAPWGSTGSHSRGLQGQENQHEKDAPRE